MEKIFNFDAYDDKIEARRKQVEFFRKKTGLSFIPSGQGYLTLCGEQSDNPHSEINQLVNMGFITKEQYYGIDKSKRVIKKNRKVHPEAHWICGDWKTVISTKKFRSAVIYLDTTSFVGADIVFELTKFTMHFCPVSTFLFVNLMLTNPYNGNEYNEDEFIYKLNQYLTPFYGQTFRAYKRCFIYTATGKTKMCTYIFRRFK